MTRDGGGPDASDHGEATEGQQATPERPRPERATGRSGAGMPAVYAGGTYWTVNGVNIFSANLVRGLNQLGGDASVLLTEEDSALITTSEARMPRPADVPFVALGHARNDGWGRHWGRMVRFLAERAPCIYIPNSDWRHSCVCPQLPNDVLVVGVVHSDDPLHYDHVRRLGHTWNIIVAVSRTVAERTAELCPELAGRIVTIPIGVPIPLHLPEVRPASDRLRLVYHGVLKQHQKRILDLPRIVQAALDRGVPVEMTIAGAGPDQEALFKAAEGLVARGHIRFPGIATPAEVGALLEAHDVYVLASEFEGMPNALIEAMGRGCVPLATQMKSGVPDLVQDGRNGFLVPVGDTGAFAERLETLWKDRELRRRLSLDAYQTVSDGRYRVEDMVRSYAEVFERAQDDAREGRFVRVPGELNHTPAEVAGVSLFPVNYSHHEPGIGAFISEVDALDYIREVRLLEAWRSQPHSATTAPDELPVDGLTVFVSCPIWVENDDSRWSEDLARGLRREGLDARLLFTEENTDLVRIPGPRLAHPSDVPVEMLTPLGEDSWAARWGALTHLLEQHAPCAYLPTYDWRHSGVTPLLPRDVLVVGTFHGLSGADTEHVTRLGRSWNAVVATSTPAARAIRQILPDLLDRLAMIPHGLLLSDANLPDEDDPAGPALVVLGPRGLDDVEAIVAGLATLGHDVTVAILEDPAGVVRLPAMGRFAHVLRPNREQWSELCRRSVVVVAADDPALDGRLREAMSHGAVPIVAESASDGTSLRVVADGVSGLRVRRGAATVIAAARRLTSERELHATLRAGASSAAVEGTYRVEQMVAAFVQVLRRARAEVERGVPVVRPGRLLLPPQAIDGVDVLPIARDHVTPVGDFSSAAEAQRFEEERRGELPPPTWVPVAGLPVFIDCPIWVESGANEWAEDLARGLRAVGLDARLLFTEENTELVRISGPRPALPSDVPVEMLTPLGDDCWGARWGTLTHLLESHAPCVYLPHYDVRHSGVSTLLPQDVMVVGTVHGARGVDLEHVARLGSAWNAVVVTNTPSADELRAALPALAERVTMIPHGLMLGEADGPSEADPGGPVLVVLGPGGFAEVDAIVRALGSLGGPVTVAVLEDPAGAVQGPVATEGVTVVRPNRGEWREQCRTSAIVIAAADPAIERRVLEAMSHGVVPVIVDSAVAGATSPVHDGRNGLRVSAGAPAVLAAVHRLRTEAGLHAALSLRARIVPPDSAYGTGDMVAAFVDLLGRVRADVQRGVLANRPGRLLLPPQSLDGVDLLPIGRDVVMPAGDFASAHDAQRFDEERSGALPPPTWVPVTGLTVFIDCPVWVESGANEWAEDLARGLRAVGLDARLLFTEENTELVRIPGPRPAQPFDVPVERLTPLGDDCWGARWGRLAHLLESHAPCVYLPHYDVRHSGVSTLLPQDVMVVGTVHGARGVDLEHVMRLGFAWNAVVATNTQAADELRAALPALAERITMIPHGLMLGEADGASEADAGGPVLVVLGPGGFAEVDAIVRALGSLGGPVTVAVLEDPAGAVQGPAATEGVTVVRPNRGEWREQCRTSAVVIAAADPAIERRVLEAMSHGVVPVIVDSAVAGATSPVLDGQNGLRVSGGAEDVRAAVNRLRSEPALHAALCAKARIVPPDSAYGTHDMVAAFVDLLGRVRADVQRGVLADRPGRLLLPPPTIDGVGVLPIARDVVTPAGDFASAREAQRFDEERSGTLPPPTSVPVTGLTVFIDCPIWLASGDNEWAEDLARGLRHAGLDARLLLTEEHTQLVQIPGPRPSLPDDVPVEMLTPLGDDGWGARWGALTRLLEANAPCVYFPNYDWRHSGICGLLPPDVMVVGTFHGLNGADVDHVRRLGPSWNAVVATSDAAAAYVRESLPDLADRLTMIPHALMFGEADVPDAGDPSGPVLVVVGPGGLPDEAALVDGLAAMGGPVTVARFDTGAGEAPAPAASSLVTEVRPNRGQWGELCRQSAILVSAPDPALDKRLVEALSHGVVPVVVTSAEADATVASVCVTDGENGLCVRGGAAEVVAAVQRLRVEPNLHASLRAQARTAGVGRYYPTTKMVKAFVELLGRVRASALYGAPVDRPGRLLMPPVSVDGMDILPIARDVETPMGAFPSDTDVRRFEEERSGVLPPAPAPEPAPDTEPGPEAETAQ